MIKSIIKIKLCLKIELGQKFILHFKKGYEKFIYICYG